MAQSFRAKRIVVNGEVIKVWNENDKIGKLYGSREWWDLQEI